MTDAPERIWIEDERPLGGEVHVWNSLSEDAKRYTVEYIRADLVEALEAENQRLREALQPFANAGTLFDGLPGEVEFDQCIYNPAAGKEYSLCGDDLRRARAALRSTREGRHGAD